LDTGIINLFNGKFFTESKSIKFQALYISISQPPLDCSFIDSLKSNGWQVATATPILAASAFEQHRPLLVLIDNRLPDLLALSKTLHCLPGADDVLFAAISDRIVSDKRRRSLSQADLYHAEQPIEICDETRSIQYVNRAYESLTGCIRNEVLGTKSSDARRKSLHSCVPRPKELDPDAVIRRASTEWHCIQVPGSTFGTQYVYVKRGSADAVMCRDISLKSVRSQSALVDAPITEVLFIIILNHYSITITYQYQYYSYQSLVLFNNMILIMIVINIIIIHLLLIKCFIFYTLYGN
uniref:PAS domain-containing protein n=1 Tax=Anisakis simplex TaxID=6269 RepID=A0A0M3JYD7_ANISI